MNVVFWVTEKMQIILLITIIILINLKLKKIRKIKEDDQLEEKNEIKKHKKKIKILVFKGIIVFICWFLLKFIVSITTGCCVNYIVSETDLILSPYIHKFNSFVFSQSFICWSILFGVYVINLINFMIREHCNKKIEIVPRTFKIILGSVIVMAIIEVRRIVLLVDFLHNTVPTISGITLNDAMYDLFFDYTGSIMSNLLISNITFIMFVFIWYYILEKRIVRIENKL